jgi:hypothetical protein
MVSAVSAPKQQAVFKLMFIKIFRYLFKGYHLFHTPNQAIEKPAI